MFQETEESILYRNFLLQWRLRFRSDRQQELGKVGKEEQEEQEEIARNKVWDIKTKQFVQSKK